MSNQFALEPMAQAILVYSESPLNYALLWQNISVSALFCGPHCDEKKINPNFETSPERPPTIKVENYVTPMRGPIVLACLSYNTRDFGLHLPFHSILRV